MTDTSNISRSLPVIIALFAGAVLGAIGILMFKGQLVRSALLNEPEIITEAIDELQKREMRERLANAGSELTEPFAGAVAGNPNGDVTVVKFTDYNCGYCRASVAEVNKLLAADKNVRIVYREMPILAESSQTAALWALAAAKQGKYFEFHNGLFNAGRPDEATISQVANEIGLDVTAAEAFVSDGAAIAELERNVGQMQKLGFNGTPTFVIGDQIFEGLTDADKLQEAVKEAREANS